MAKNSLGEIIGTPGAYRREMAAAFDRVSETQARLAEIRSGEAARFHVQAEVLHERADAARILPPEDRKRRPSDYVLAAARARAKAKPANEAAAAHERTSREFGRKALGSSILAKIQTVAAKVGIPRNWVPE